ncbi:MAG: hypothetical protein A2029_05995 [Chloroflexi bacterium RBG_19FT_COMBO_47_9]|nr:MAG: hypothetical protein A2029_05995 [Chloroflexi bacterium RBG_19FT_COMBO_47_9]
MVNQSGSDDGQQADDLKNRRGRISVGFNLVIMIVGIAIAEILAMIIISYFISLDYYQLVIIDTSIMAIIIIPWLYIFSISPLLKQIRQQAQAESILQARQRIMEYASAHGLSDLLEYTLNEIEALTESTISFFHFMETDQKTINLQAWSTNTLQNMCKAEGKGSHYDLERAGVWADAVRQRKPIIHNDYAQQPNRKGLPEGHASVVREMVIPIIREDKVVAVLGSGNKPRDYTTNDLEIISKIGDFAWDVVDHKQADIAIQESEEKFHTLID